MVEHAEGLEPSYNVGISPNREYTTATPFPGTSNWPAKGSRGDKVGQKLSAAAAASSAHDFFKNAVLPKAHAAAHAAQHAAKSKESEQLHQKASVAAQPYVREADRAKQRASKTAQELKRDLGKAITAEKLAGVARQQAVRVGEAEAQVDKAQHKLSEEKKVFLSNMAQVKTEMPKAHKQEHKSATARQQKAQTQAHLDADTEKDMKENKALAAPSDLDGFFGSVNANSHDGTNAYREPHAPAVEPNEAGPLAKIVTGKKKKAAVQPVLHAEKTVEHKAKKHEQHAQKKKAVAQQVLHAKPKRSNNKRSKATAAAHHKALREAQHAPKGIVIQDKDLCAIRCAERERQRETERQRDRETETERKGGREGGREAQLTLRRNALPEDARAQLYADLCVHMCEPILRSPCLPMSNAHRVCVRLCACVTCCMLYRCILVHPTLTAASSSAPLPIMPVLVQWRSRCAACGVCTHCARMRTPSSRRRSPASRLFNIAASRGRR